MTEKWRVYLPIMGVKFRNGYKEFDIGNIKFCYTNAEEMGLGDPYGNYPNVSKNTEYLCVSTEVEADKDNSIDFALEYIEDALSVIRFAITHGWGILPPMGIITARKFPKYSEVLAKCNNGKGYREPLYPKRRQYEFRITPEEVIKWEKLYAREILDLLLKKHQGVVLTPLDEMIVNVLVWCGSSIEDVHPRDALLRGVTAVESIVQYKCHIQGAGKISKYFREYAAVLLCMYENSPASFQTYSKFFKQIYEIRCSISHGGSFSNEEYLTILMRIEKERLIHKVCLSALLLWKEVTNMNDFYNKIEQERLRYQLARW
ncbi:HEPN domain-containing protein [Bacillus toyonensis]|uniref:HEPN domain-containing protein n=1 Tax=Bacillus toyonensis TaxID=155322 RepID=UPI0021CF778B|nr:HEPN domain-containing protein [Bacillus toyonensis]MCU5583029.1 HEPN domain-containing protein [Bacillus toyonensis]